VNDKDFFDTNIVVYAYSHDEPEKQVIAKNLFKKTLPVVRTQVLGEFANVLRRQFRCEYPEIAAAVIQVTKICQVVTLTSNHIIRALALADKYGYHFYDCLILATALAENCTRVYSEDLQHGQVIESTLTIHNPFTTRITS
jgi:predicted nucleic acid-binding protein